MEPPRSQSGMKSLVFFVFLLALVVFSIVALSTFVGPLFHAKKAVHGKEYHVTIKGSNETLQKAFTVVFWLLVVLSIVGPFITGKDEGKKSASFIKSVIFLSLTILCYVGVGFLTAEVWKKQEKDKDGNVVLTFKKDRYVVLQITTILLLISLALPIAAMVLSVAGLFIGVGVQTGMHATSSAIQKGKQSTKPLLRKK